MKTAMKMKKFVLVCFVAVFLLGVSTVSNAEVLRYAIDTLIDLDSYIYAPPRWLAKTIEEASQGKVKVEIIGGGALGTGKSALEQVQAGLIHFARGDEALLSYFYPNMQVLAIPYLFRTYDVAYEVLRGPFGEELKEDFRKKTGMRIVGWLEGGGFRCFTTGKKKIRSPADMKGLKIRTMEIPAHMAMVKALGASPVPIAWMEVYTALQTGVADGQENAIPVILLGKLEEVQKYMILDNHLYSVGTCVTNDAWFQKQNKELQLAILSAGRIMDNIARGICRLTDLNGADYLKKKGMEIYQPSAEEYAQFRSLTQRPVIEWLRKQPNVESVWVDKLLNAVERAEKKLGYQ